MPAFPSLIAMVGLIVVPAAAGSVIHVDASAPDGGDGQLWETAFDDLQDAIAAAVPGDELWIAAATYTPAPPGGPREATFALIDGPNPNDGYLPDGLVLFPVGTMIGTPQSAGIYVITLRVRDFVGAEATREFTLTVAASQ